MNELTKLWLHHESTKKLAIQLMIIAAIGLVLFPIFAIIMISFNPSSSLGGQLIPEAFTLDHWRYVLGLPYQDPLSGSTLRSGFPIMTWLANSLKISGITAVCMIIMSTSAAYALSRLEFRAKQWSLLVVMIIQMFPNIMAMVAFYVLLDKLGILLPSWGTDTHGGLILVYLGGTPFNIWLIKGYFDTLPKSIEEAASLDGCSRFQIFRRIVLPLSAPILAVVATLTFINTFSDFLLPSILLKSQENLTFSVGIQIFIAESFSSRWGPFAAACLMGALPLAAMFLAIHRYIIGGLALGASKG